MCTYSYIRPAVCVVCMLPVLSFHLLLRTAALPFGAAAVRVGAPAGVGRTGGKKKKR